jgi:hypothetical protein
MTLKSRDRKGANISVSAPCYLLRQFGGLPQCFQHAPLIGSACSRDVESRS